MTISKDQLEQIATLARLALTEEEKERYAKQMTQVLGYIDMLGEVDTSSIEETCQVTGLEDVVREDVAVDCDEETKQKLMSQFPEKLGNLLRVKAVFKD